MNPTLSALRQAQKSLYSGKDPMNAAEALEATAIIGGLLDYLHPPTGTTRKDTT